VRREAGGQRPSTTALQGVRLALIEKSTLRARDEFLRRPEIIGVIRLPPSGERDLRGVVKIVIPHGIEAEPRLLRRAQHPHVLSFVLGHNDDGPDGGPWTSARRRPRKAGQP